MTDRPAPEAGPPESRPGRLSALRRFGGFLVVILVFFLFRALTADDGTHGVGVGECVAAAGTDDFRAVDCSDPGAVGTVTFLDRNTPTDPASARRLCAAHGAQGAFTSATSDGGAGTVICVAERP